MRKELQQHPFFVDHEIRELAKLAGGLNHQVYKVTTNQGVFVARSITPASITPTPTTQQSYDLAIQDAIYHLGFTPKVIYHEAMSSIAIIQYIAGEHPQVGDWSKATLNEFAAILATVHCHQPIQYLPSLNLIGVLERYDQQLALNHATKVQVSQALQQLNHWPTKCATIGLCHNDLNANNMIVHQGKLWLLDWEYAAIGDIYFDLAGFIVEHALTPAAEEMFLTAYQSHRTDLQLSILSNKLIQMKAIYQLVCHLWHIENNTNNTKASVK